MWEPSEPGDSFLTLGEILRLAARRAPRKTAVIAGDRRFDFGEYDRLANRFANLLISAGVGPGDRIASLLFNSPEYGVVHFGNARAGSVLVHIPPLYAAAEIAEILERTRPRVLVVDSAVRNRLSDDCLSAIPTLIVTGVPTVDGALDGALEFGEAVAAQPDTPPDGEIDPAAPVAMTFTGGTTGRPKGAVVSHTARFVSAASTAREHQVAAQDVVGVVTPMFHAVGLMIWYQASILVGSTAVIFRRWDPAEFIAETERHRISSVFLVPVQVRDLLRSPAFDRERLASLRNIGVGGAPTPPGLIEECREALPHCGYTDHYGQSETGPLTILKPRDTGTHAGTVGQPAAGVDLRIVDPDGNPVPRGTIGEVVARGPFLMEGYFEDEEETARFPRRLGLDGGSRGGRRRGVHPPGRQVPRSHHFRGFQHLPLRGRDRAREPPRGRGLHGLRRPGRALGGGAGGLRGPGSGHLGGQTHRPLRESPGPLQAPPRDRLRGHNPPHPLRQGPKAPPPRRVSKSPTGVTAYRRPA